ncbi:uncharacterized protein LOC110029659 [Phalaenopsis equestris]|uniref:uncharacterized protein LOC110029659 n=1 Tax=Phalaenopsis equestris TaxID=78828 RepID=UPI0009E3DFC5|nr:uncharacterized protein LOC110029659 [Phalaenopsis equestris]
MHHQTTNHSRIIRIKNELHNVSMNMLSISEYLMQIKATVDNISATGSHVDVEDIILYILKVLPTTYCLFTTSIRTRSTPISLDELYAILISEEINLLIEQAAVSTKTDPHQALYSAKTKNRYYKGKACL